MSDKVIEITQKKTAAERRAEERQKFFAALPKTAMEAFRTPDGLLYLRYQVGDHSENWPLRSETATSWLEHQFYLKLGIMPEKKVINELLRQLEGEARFKNEPRPVYLRTADYQGSIVIDLCDEPWRAVVVTPDGWRVVDDSPVRFRRSSGMKSLPIPVKEGVL